LKILCALGFVLPLLSLSTAVSAPANALLDRGRTEPVVAVDPRNPSTIVVGTNPDYSSPLSGTMPMAYFASQNGGRTFRRGFIPIVGRYTVAADPSVAVARNGTVFYSYVGVRPGTYDCSGCSCTPTREPRAAILLSRSRDHGRSFQMPTLVDAAQDGDRPSLAVESLPHAPPHVFLTWARSGNDVWYARSIDGGVHFSPPQEISASSYATTPSIPVAGPKGHIYVFWIETGGGALSNPTEARMRMRASSDDGAHFGPVRDVVPWFETMPRAVQPGNLRTPPMLAVAADHGGALYAAWPIVRQKHAGGSVDADILLTRSADGGASWRAPFVVNDVRRADRFMPAMSVFPDNSLGLAFYDRRAGANRLGVFAVHVAFDGTFHRSPNVRVNRRYANIAFIHPIAAGSSCYSPGRFFGDYMGAGAAPRGRLCVTWADSGLGVRDETDVWFAKVGLPPTALAPGHTAVAKPIMGSHQHLSSASSERRTAPPQSGRTLEAPR
jgi:hypothetical protein